MTLRKIDGSRRGHVPPEIRALADLYRLHNASADNAKRELQRHGWAAHAGPPVEHSQHLADVAEALSDMIELADAWAASGPEGYTPEERQRRNRAERILTRLQRRLAKGGAP